IFAPMMLGGRRRKFAVVDIAVIAAVNYLADADLGVAVIVVVGAEDPAEAIDGQLVGIAEIVGQDAHLGAVAVDAAHEGAIGVVLDAGVVGYRHADIADREIKSAIRPQADAVQRMIMIDPLWRLAAPLAESCQEDILVLGNRLVALGGAVEAPPFG